MAQTRDPREIIQQALAANQGLIDKNQGIADDMLLKRATQAPIEVQKSVASPNDLGDGDDEYAMGESGLELTLDRALNQMMAESGGKITLSSGRRSPERQQQLWDEALRKYGDPEIADNWVARPGTSRHERGEAGDLQFADDATRQWAHQNAARFGLTFPMAHEPWHIERVRS